MESRTCDGSIVVMAPELIDELDELLKPAGTVESKEIKGSEGTACHLVLMRTRPLIAISLSDVQERRRFPNAPIFNGDTGRLIRSVKNRIRPSVYWLSSDGGATRSYHAYNGATSVPIIINLETVLWGGDNVDDLTLEDFRSALRDIAQELSSEAWLY